MVTHSKVLTISVFSDSFRNSYLQLRPDFRPRLASVEPTRTGGRVFLFNHFNPHNARLSDPSSGTEGLRGKGIFMTFNLERYRAYVAPLKLTREQEDELLKDLWAITEVLVDQSLSSPVYPLQLMIACDAFDALEQAIAVESKSTQIEEETP